VTREETLAFFAKCETARIEALKSGKSVEESANIGRKIWNDWAEESRKELRALLSQGEKLQMREIRTKLSPEAWVDGRKEWLDKHSPRIRYWIEKSIADFSDNVFQVLNEEERLTFSGNASRLQNIDRRGNNSAYQGLGAVNFDGFIFPGEAVFSGATFSGAAWFDYAEFDFPASFDGCIFAKSGSFGEVKFMSFAWFRSAEFGQVAWFESSRFGGAVSFRNAWCRRVGHFGSCKFGGPASFAGVRFDGDAVFIAALFSVGVDFRAVTAGSMFDLTASQFSRVPDFLQCKFAAPLRLDNIEIAKPKVGPELGDSHYPQLRRPLRGSDPDVPARYRELRRLASLSDDSARVLEFHAQEIRASRFVTDWPWHWRFWFGYAYGMLANFGRSVTRPLMFWAVTVLICGAFYLSEHRDFAQANAGSSLASIEGLRTRISNTLSAWMDRKGCFDASARSASNTGTINTEQGTIKPLAAAILQTTNAAHEAFQLSLRNATVVLDTGGDAAHRSYGCLYGVEYFGTNPVAAVVPPNLSMVCAIQKILSGIFIFLFGLALKNMLKLK
jgi:hypothetical protein